MGHWTSTRLGGYPSGGYRAWWSSAAGSIALGIVFLLFGVASALDQIATLRLLGVALVFAGAVLLARGGVLTARRRRRTRERRAALPQRDRQDPDLLPDLPPVPPPFRRSGRSPSTDP
jgi:drug/metabolite transporter (DMT)-like permease